MWEAKLVNLQHSLCHTIQKLIVKSCQGLKCLKIRGKSSGCVSQHVGRATEGEAGEVGWPSVRNTGEKVGEEGTDLQSTLMWPKSLISTQPRQERDRMVSDQGAESSR